MDRNPSIWRGAGIFALGVLTLGILLRLAWNLFVFCDEYNFSPEAVCGSGLDLGLLWLRLLAALLLLLGGLGLLFRLPLVRVVMVLSVVNLGISLRLLGTLLLFCHRQGMAPALVCGSSLHWGAAMGSADRRAGAPPVQPWPAVPQACVQGQPMIAPVKNPFPTQSAPPRKRRGAVFPV